eukprot:4515626-Pyramimonas_sp.AAC.2
MELELATSTLQRERRMLSEGTAANEVLEGLNAQLVQHTKTGVDKRAGKGPKWWQVIHLAANNRLQALSEPLADASNLCPIPCPMSPTFVQSPV